VTPTFTRDILVTSRTIFAGGAIKLSVAATGGGLSYQWKKNTTDIPGQTNASLTINAVVATNAGSYTVVVSNGAGSATSAAWRDYGACPGGGKLRRIRCSRWANKLVSTG
jgi:hypothetical protein